jgi:penicillin V acylase-like amidase (Ntn superfamily)
VHYLISDASGNSTVIEYLDNDLKILRADEQWQVSTNFTLSGKTLTQALSSCNRYKKAYTTLENYQGNISQDQAMSLLSSVSQSSTIWSILYNTVTMDIHLAMGRNYTKIYDFKLGQGTP